MKNWFLASFQDIRVYFWEMKKKIAQRLIFVYDADSGTRNVVLDRVHKIVSPSTYGCNLCNITHGLFRENRKWKHFRQESAYQMIFFHKDEFLKQYASKFGHKFHFPVVLVEAGTELEILIPAPELNSLKSPVELIELIEGRTTP